MCQPGSSLVWPSDSAKSSLHQPPGIDWFELTNGDGLGSVFIRPNRRSVVAFYVEQHNTHLARSAFRGQTPDEMYVGAGMDIPKQLEASRIAARQSRTDLPDMRRNRFAQQLIGLKRTRKPS